MELKVYFVVPCSAWEQQSLQAQLSPIIDKRLFLRQHVLRALALAWSWSKQDNCNTTQEEDDDKQEL